MRTSADEERSPKYSHIERERRFLVDSVKLPRLDGPAVLIEDRYMIGTRFRLRRMTDEGSGIVALKLAKKYEASDPIARPMVNAYLTAAEYRVFSVLPAEIIVKRRIDLQVGDDLFSIDRFEGSLVGLVLAEIDGADEASLVAIDPPDWAIRDVSHDAAFRAARLPISIRVVWSNCCPSRRTGDPRGPRLRRHLVAVAGGRRDRCPRRA